ncbi:thiol methyltransferase 1 [Macrolepiota fuliginosa MF-IS2]|uniref:Thiol methyltransferase 1 n=1 Tax=Macrolepiota fuliginosa MF-IS2 TaxID=1400762 RepID=A0A9P5XD74_9AGAR|nr:thiol methyltransferase 1 [Macrolepiota fuliginosa MF-IS2]
MPDLYGIGFVQSDAVQHMRKIVDPGVTSTWDDAWKVDATPWAAGEVQPPLREAIEVNRDEIKWPKTGRALVPGCGLGYDVTYLAGTLGINALGLDASQTVLDRARASVKENPPPQGEASFEVANFFTYKPAEGFDLVYDYTFFVAIPPSLRGDWGKKMTELIKPGGYLITLVFPIDPYFEGGPPHYVQPEHYDEYLSSAFDKVVDRVPEMSAPGHVGRERLIVWKRV